MKKFRDFKKVKICHVLSKLDVGGMENGVVNICNNLDRSKFEPHICCLKDYGAMLERLKHNVKILKSNFPDGKAPFRPVKLAFIFNDLRPDIVHTHGWGGGLFDGVLGAKLAGVPIIVNGEHGSFFVSPHQVFFQRILFRMCDSILTVSDSLCDKVSGYFKISKKKIEVIPNGVDTDIFHGRYNKEEIYEQVGGIGFKISPDDFIIGMVGSLRAVKNNMMLLKAIKSIKEEEFVSNIKILFIGDGPEKEKLEAYCRTNNLDKIVCFLGQRNNIPELFSIINTLVLCSLSEGMSNVLLEAMASGVPVICSEGSDTKNEIVKDKYNGIMFRNNDINALSKAIIEISNKRIRNVMSKNAREFIRKEYSISLMVKKYEKFYLSIYNNNF